MKAIWCILLLVCSCYFISVSCAEENSELICKNSESLCEEQVNRMFCTRFRRVTRRVIEGPQFLNTFRRIFEIFIENQTLIETCEPSHSFIFNVTTQCNFTAPNNQSILANNFTNSSGDILRNIDCEYRIVDDIRICINQTMVSSWIIAHGTTIWEYI